MTHRTLPVAAGIALALIASACKSDRPIPPKQTVEETPAAPGAAASLSSTINMGDARQEPQLLNGFFGIEANSWRWTGGKFAVMLKTPTGSAQTGATLKFSLSVPQPSIDQLKSITLGASVNGTELDPETYTKDGGFEYKRDVPARLLSGSSVRIDFHVDKTRQPGGADVRQLGLVARSVGLETK
jgi:hypothetical protein